jgi:hypothetical protein
VIRAATTRTKLLKFMANGVKDAKKRFDPRTGRFLTDDGGWSVTSQDIIWPLAALYTAKGRGRYSGDKSLLKLCARGGDALCDWMNPDGSFVFIKVDGSTWGDIYMCWTMYHWLEAYILLEPHLDPARRRRWAKYLRRTFGGVADRYRQAGFQVHNIPAWHAMGMILAAKVFNEPRWAEEGLGYIRQVAGHQHVDGYWPEGGGPTTIYNMVYVHAMGICHLLTGDRVALRALERAIAFHGHFTYPDGSGVETVDGRVKYHAGAGPMGLVGLSLTPDGRGLLELLLENIIKKGSKGGLNPHLATLWKYLQDGPAVAPLQKSANVVSTHPPGKWPRGLVRRKGPWFVCLSGYLTPKKERAGNSRSRWLMDRQQHVSLWHEDLGLLVGGGNSKFQPDRSTFAVWQGGHCRHEADSADLSKSAKSGDSITLRYGGQLCRLSVRVLNSRKVELAFSAPDIGDREVQAGFLLRFVSGWKLRTSRQPDPAEILPNQQVICRWPRKDRGARWFETDRYRVSVPTEACVYWPQYPFNPYAIDGAAPAASAVAHVGVQLKRGRSRAKFVIEVKPGG